MTHTATRIILEEHAALAAMLRSIPMLLAQHRGQGTLPDFAVLRARTPLSHNVLDPLDADHASGERSIRDLEHALLGFEMMGEPRRQAFEQAAERYVSFYLAHMAMEEQRILPLAEQVLTDDDWAELDEALGANCDPLTGHEPEADYRALFARIVNSVPAPVGLGPSIR